jgi:hypothetical protein
LGNRLRIAAAPSRNSSAPRPLTNEGRNTPGEELIQASGKKVLILATNGFEQAELEVPRDTLKAAGATVDIVSPEKGQIKGWNVKDWGTSVKVEPR